MIEIVKNKSNISEEEINNIITRVKALIITSDNKILLGHSFCEYQFPGGHVENNEALLPALKRELEEETGLVFDTENLEAFAVLKKYFKDYPSNGINTKLLIYYYVIKDDRVPILKNTNYTDEELDGNFSLRYVPLDIVKCVINDNINTCGDVEGIAKEMLEILDCFFNINV